MAYEVTATRRRPKTFDELAGQEFVSSTLKSSLEQGSIAHAYLFSGPRGCGKTSAARILARSLNCERGPTPVPCGVCSACQEISRGSSLDIIEIDGASNTSVNDVRQIKDEVLFPPHSGKYKVYIIDEVHMLSNSAFNALLKTIEEPPPYIIFIFATTELHKVPATIKSRCQQFAFKSIPVDTIRRILKETCGEMNIQAEDEALFWIAREATGSMRDAYTLLDQVSSFCGGNIRSTLIKEKLGLVGLEELNALAESCADNDTAAAFAAIDKLLESGVAIEQFVIDLAGYYRSILLLKAGITKESLLGYGKGRFSARVWEKLSLPQLEEGLSILLGLYRDIRYSLSPRFELEATVAKLCWLDRWISPPELRAAVEAARGVLKKPGGTALAGSAVPAEFSDPGNAANPVKSGADQEPAVKDPGSSGEASTAEGFMDKPGAFTEGFKHLLAQRSGEKAPGQNISEEAELVRRVFRGTVVNQDENQ
ncbi:MAG: DNA polymerase III subunit gamma/tau [Spirochaetaceae bacterium]|jgi:DNA polymerase-3 subunit gamma/tau|nr:DNA polymerase III subunit gamma/tau [Spirochaetaceae bacterium]